MPMAVKVCQKLAMQHSGVVEFHDLLNQAYLHIAEAIDSYQDKSDLSTYIYNFLKWRLTDYIRKHYIIVKIHPADVKKLKQNNVSLNYCELEVLSYKEKTINLYEEEEDSDDCPAL